MLSITVFVIDGMLASNALPTAAHPGHYDHGQLPERMDVRSKLVLTMLDALRALLSGCACPVGYFQIPIVTPLAGWVCSLPPVCPWMDVLCRIVPIGISPLPCVVRLYGIRLRTCRPGRRHGAA